MKIFKIIPLLLVLAVTFVACEKDDEVTYEADRSTIVRIKDSDDLIQFARDVLPAVEEFVLIDLRRDATRPSDMSQPLTVKLQKDPAILTAYNAAHGTGLC